MVEIAIDDDAIIEKNRTVTARMRASLRIGKVGGNVVGLCTALALDAPPKAYNDPTLSDALGLLVVIALLGGLILPMVVSALAPRRQFLVALVPLAIGLVWLLAAEAYALHTNPKLDNIWKSGTSIEGHGAPNIWQCLLFFGIAWLVTSAPISFVKWLIAIGAKRRERSTAKILATEVHVEGSWPPKPQA